MGKWHRLATPLFRTPLHRNSKDRKAAARTGADSLQIHYDFTALEDLITELASPRVPAGAVCGSERHRYVYSHVHVVKQNSFCADVHRVLLYAAVHVCHPHIPLVNVFVELAYM